MPDTLLFQSVPGTVGISRSFWNEALSHPAFSSLGLQGREEMASSGLRQTQFCVAIAALPCLDESPTAHPGSGCVTCHTQHQICWAQRVAKAWSSSRRPRPPQLLAPPHAGPAHRLPHAAPSLWPDLSPQRALLLRYMPQGGCPGKYSVQH